MTNSKPYFYMSEFSGVTTTSGSNSTSGTNTTTTTVTKNWEKEYFDLLTKYQEVLKEIDNLGFTLLSYSRTMKQKLQE